ncbi:MAG: hypothetical protein PUE18_06660 [Firmicutes bacterium]|nr:hypothetical protein [Bacillota bacterium]
MKKGMRGCAVALIISLVVMQMSTITFAGTDIQLMENKSHRENLLQKSDINEETELNSYINADLKILDDMGALVDSKITNINELQENNLATRKYILDFGDVINTIEVIENTDDAYTVKITENEKMNIFTKTKEGKVIIDGQEVVMTMIGQKQSLNDGNAVMPLATETWFQDSCPYGDTTDYTYLQTTMNYNKTAIKFNVALRSLTFSAFRGALFKSVANWVGITGAKKFAAKTVLSKLIQYNPESKSVSYSIKAYTHKNYTNGFITPIITRVWKYQYQYYATPNLTGSYTTEYEFKCQM